MMNRNRRRVNGESFIFKKRKISKNIKEKDNKFTIGGITIWWNWLWSLCIYENF